MKKESTIDTSCYMNRMIFVNQIGKTNNLGFFILKKRGEI